MRHLFILYKVELKKIRPALIVLPVMYGIAYLYFRYGESSQVFRFPGVVVFLLTNATILVPPVMFAFLLNDELKFNTVYQLFSLPCRRYTILLSKYLVATTVCIITTFGTAAFLKQLEYSNSYGFDTRSFRDVVLTTFTNVSWITGITCMTAGIILSIKRHRQAAGVMLIMALLFLSSKVYDLFEWLGDNGVESLQWTGKHDWNSVAVFIGIVFVILGHIIYEKYGEI